MCRAEHFGLLDGPPVGPRESGRTTADVLWRVVLPTAVQFVRRRFRADAAARVMDLNTFRQLLQRALEDGRGYAQRAAAAAAAAIQRQEFQRLVWGCRRRTLRLAAPSPAQFEETGE